MTTEPENKTIDAKFRENKFHDITHLGIRLVLGSIFLVHGISKFDPMFAGFLSQIGIPAEMQIPIALAELISGILLIVGILSRISASLLSVIMLGAIFYVKKASSLTGEMGIEFDLILLATNLAIITIGPGRISLSQVVKKIPKFLQ